MITIWVCQECNFETNAEDSADEHNEDLHHELRWMYDDNLGEEFETELDQWEAGWDGT